MTRRRTKNDIKDEVLDLLAAIRAFRGGFDRLTPRTKTEILDLLDAYERVRNPMEQIDISLNEWLEGIRA
jgi:hypothetical protein